MPYIFIQDDQAIPTNAMNKKPNKDATKDSKDTKRTPMKSPRDITDTNAANTANEQPAAANIRPSGNSTNRGSDMTQSSNTGRGVENDRSR